MNGESAISFKELFSKDIDRNINGVIKANDEKNLDDEVNEYVLTEEICRNLAKFLDAYNDPSNHEQNGAWISGFFGSGKSHLLKMLSHVLGEVPAELASTLYYKEPYAGITTSPQNTFLLMTLKNKKGRGFIRRNLLL